MNMEAPIMTEPGHTGARPHPEALYEALKRGLYALAEAATAGHGLRRTVGGEAIRFPLRVSRYYPGDYEAATFRFLRRHCRQGGVAYDVGAHFGVFTVTLARLVGEGGQVMAFEPNATVRKVLTRVVRLNGLDATVTVRPEAVAAGTGVASFFVPGWLPFNAASSLVRGDRSAYGAEQVTTVSLDQIAAGVARPPALIKIDAEGAELDVLRGARTTIARWRPPLLVGVHPVLLPAGGLAELWAELERHHYTVVSADNSRPLTRDWFCGQSGIFDVGALPEPPSADEPSTGRIESRKI